MDTVTVWDIITSVDDALDELITITAQREV